MINARVISEGKKLKAILSDGRVFHALEPREMARNLVTAGLHVDHAHCADWREGEAAPMAGQAIALKTEMRRLAKLGHGNI